MAGAGVWILLIPWIKYPVLFISAPFGLRFAVLTAAFFLFVPPLTLLGMVSPYAIRIGASNLGTVGRTAGNLYATSTLGGVISALLVGFLLIPNIGVNRLTFAIGAVLAITASVGLVSQRKRGKNIAAILLLLFTGVIVSWPLAADRADPAGGLIALEQSPYAEIRVLDMADKRHLLIDGGVHTIVDTSTWQSHFPYTAVVDLTREFFDNPGDLLLIGLGGGTVVKNFAREGWRVEAVEIDPVVAKVARQHFGLQESEGKIFHQDGRQFLLTHKNKYDIIIMDAFGSSSIPFHLVTTEAFGLVAAHLEPDGVFALNVEVYGWEDLIVRSLAATLKMHFKVVRVLPAFEPPNGLGNVINIAANRPLELADEPWPAQPPPNYKHSLAYRRIFAWNNRIIADTRNAPVLTDDLNPVDLWSERLNRIARQDLHRYFATSGLSW